MVDKTLKSLNAQKSIHTTGFRTNPQLVSKLHIDFPGIFSGMTLGKLIYEAVKHSSKKKDRKTHHRILQSL